mgnify:CR=1 FL=1
MFAQDTLVYSQKNSVMFSNKYLLFPKTNKFEHVFKTDDGQTWFGKGTYTIKKNKIILNFGDSEENIKSETQIEKIYDKSNVFEFFLSPSVIEYKTDIVYGTTAERS